ncbi:MAG: type VI secretion lipoprotein TssJ, partial [Proteobacteria bacterium]|nr:type VI secretion lipoprotein TssJ [Pseudomonadota bacterium]
MEICTHLFSNAAKRTKSCTVQQINRYGFFFITFLLLMMSGCTQWGSSITPLKIFPATNLNPSGEKRSLPVMVRVYLLKSENAFAR